jgi:hypothetical protein
MENKINITEIKKKNWSKPKLYTPLEIKKTFDAPEGTNFDDFGGYSS